MFNTVYIVMLPFKNTFFIYIFFNFVWISNLFKLEKFFIFIPCGM